MRFSAFREGLDIFAKYFDAPDGYHFGAEHDVFYVYKTDKPIEADDVTKLVELGWFQEAVEREDDGEDFAASDYDPEEGWTAYV